MRISNANLIALKTGRMLRESSARVRSNLHSLSGTSTWNTQNSVTTRLKSQISDLAQRIKTSSTAVAFLNSTDSALAQQEEVLQKMRELTLSASATGASSVEREAIRKELQALLEEINRIGKDAEFNGKRLLDGSNERVEWALSSIENTVLEMPQALAKDLFKMRVGTGLFGPETSVGLIDGRFSHADLNNDGFEDIISNNGSSLEVYLNNGNGGLQTTASFSGTYVTSDVGDVNGDGILDLLVSDTYTSIYLGLGNGKFSSSAITAAGTRGAIGDLNNDGLGDIAVMDAGGDLDVLTFNGSTFNKIADISEGDAFASVNDIYIKDFNNDGNLDVFYRTNGVFSTFLAFGDGTGSFASPVSNINIGSDGPTIDFSDIDGDGFLDIVTSDTGANPVVGYGSITGTFTTSVPTGGNGTINNQVFADVNRDGNIDIVTIEEDFVLSAFNARVYFGNGGRNFEITSQFRTGISPTSFPGGILVLDLNNDQILDLFYGDTFYSGLYEEKTNYSNLQLLNQDQIDRMIETIDLALSKVLGARSRVGTKLSELQSRQDYLSKTQTTLEDASEGLQPDIGNLITQITVDQIKMNAQLAVMAQANLQAQSVLRLLNDLVD